MSFTCGMNAPSPLPQSTLNLTNPNFFSVLVQSVSCQVLYMKMVIGLQVVDTPTTILPLSQRQVSAGQEAGTGKVELRVLFNY